MRVNGQSSRYFGRLGGKRQNWSVLYRLFICLKLKCPRKMRKKDTRHHESMLCSVNEACIEESNGRSPFTPNYTEQSTNNRSVGSCYIRLVLQSQTEQNSFRARWCFSDIAPRQKNVLPNREGYQCETRQRKLGTKYIGGFTSCTKWGHSQIRNDESKRPRSLVFPEESANRIAGKQC